MSRKVVSPPVSGIREAARVGHKLENELAAIRIRVGLVLTIMSSELNNDEELLRSDLEQILLATEESIKEARKLTRWIHDADRGE